METAIEIVTYGFGLLVGTGLLRGVWWLGTMASGVREMKANLVEVKQDTKDFRAENIKAHGTIHESISGVGNRVTAVETALLSLPCNGRRICPDKGGGP